LRSVLSPSDWNGWLKQKNYVHRNHDFPKSSQTSNCFLFFGVLAGRARDQLIDDAIASRMHFKIKYDNLGLEQRREEGYRTTSWERL
jgi:hypothetical protein